MVKFNEITFWCCSTTGASPQRETNISQQRCICNCRSVATLLYTGRKWQKKKIIIKRGKRRCLLERGKCASAVRVSAQLCKRPFTREQIPRNKGACGTRGHRGNVLSESYGACTFYTYTRFEKQFIESLGRRAHWRNGQRRRRQRAHLFQLYTGCTCSSAWLLLFLHSPRKEARARSVAFTPGQVHVAC